MRNEGRRGVQHLNYPQGHELHHSHLKHQNIKSDKSSVKIINYECLRPFSLLPFPVSNQNFLLWHHVQAEVRQKRSPHEPGTTPLPPSTTAITPPPPLPLCKYLFPDQKYFYLMQTINTTAAGKHEYIGDPGISFQPGLWKPKTEESFAALYH